MDFQQSQRHRKCRAVCNMLCSPRWPELADRGGSLELGDNNTNPNLVRDSSAVRRLFVRLAGAVGRKSALHKENSGLAAPTPGRHISMFRGYQILFSIRNPYINLFNHFSIHS